MTHPLTLYASAWLLGWDEVFGDPAKIRPDELTPQMMRIAWSLRRRMRANAHHVAAQRLALDDLYYLRLPKSRLDMRVHSRDTYASCVDEVQRARAYDRKSRIGGLKLSGRARSTRSAMLLMGSGKKHEARLARIKAGRAPARSVQLHCDDATSKAGILASRKDGRDELRKRLAQNKLLSGPATRHAVDELFSALYEESPWLSEPLTYMWHCAQDAVDDPGTGFSLPPTLLVGPPGCGKTHLAQRLSELSGCPSTRLDMSGLNAAFEIAGTEHTWRDSSPSAVVKLIDVSNTANPVMIIDEVDKAGRSNAGDPAQALLPLLQRSTAKDFRESYLQAVIDLSRVSWILLANDLQRVPAPLIDRCAVFQVGYPRGDDLRKLVSRRLVKAEPEIVARVVAEIEAGRMSLRGLHRIAQEVRRISRQPMLN